MRQLPELSEGAQDRPGEVCWVHRVRALVRAYGMVTGLPLAAALEISGDFDAATTAAIREIQEHAHLDGTGQVQPAGWSLLITGAP